MSIDGIFADLRTLAAATGTQSTAETAIAEATSTLGEIDNSKAGPRTLLLEWADPAYSPGHWVPEQLLAAGCPSSIGAPGDHSRALAWEEIEAANPEAIGIICCGYGLEENVRFATTIRNNPAVSSWFRGPIVAFDANRLFSRPTLAVVTGAQRIHEAFVLKRDIGDGFQAV